MSGSMEFWATCVKPNKPVKVTVQDGMTLRLTQVAPHHLARGRASRGGRERVRRRSVHRRRLAGRSVCETRITSLSGAGDAGIRPWGGHPRDPRPTCSPSPRMRGMAHFGCA